MFHPALKRGGHAVRSNLFDAIVQRRGGMVDVGVMVLVPLGQTIQGETSNVHGVHPTLDQHRQPAHDVFQFQLCFRFGLHLGGRFRFGGGSTGCSGSSGSSGIVDRCHSCALSCLANVGVDIRRTQHRHVDVGFAPRQFAGHRFRRCHHRVFRDTVQPTCLTEAGQTGRVDNEGRLFVQFHGGYKQSHAMHHTPKINVKRTFHGLVGRRKYPWHARSRIVEQVMHLTVLGDGSVVQCLKFTFLSNIGVQCRHPLVFVVLGQFLNQGMVVRVVHGCTVLARGHPSVVGQNQMHALIGTGLCQGGANARGSARDHGNFVVGVWCVEEGGLNCGHCEFSMFCQ